ncbi:hypothetical protein K458DRAFT_447123 [Lentithecium fluviatile CBS 122367]|uniref:Uncharacterized protein n=1 Tax=Lentithecium fluviatile CBS 122367 TaxID=1168545 RepID=A0A6G1IFY4_9PLEO|nr:hypothetical protein K458DRAFT_447123 [Lentithecium fluviatile CBS 122367]
MSTYLFSAGKLAKFSSSARHKPISIPRHLFNIVRGASDSVDALQLFLKLLHEEEVDKTSPGYLAFDAHVGDTSCQLRACMLLEILNRYRQHGSSAMEVCSIEQTIERLKKVIENARTFCQNICNLAVTKATPETLGMSKHGMSIDEILQRLEWTEIRTPRRSQELSNPTLFYSVASSVVSRSTSRDRSSEGGVGNTNTIASSATSISDAAPTEQNEKQLEAPSIVFAEASSDYWEPWDWHQVVHFLVYSYILSKYKHFIIRDINSRQNMESVIRENICWDLSQVTDAELDELRQSCRPHIVVCGNSLDGETAEYLERLPTTKLHMDDNCEENMQHCKDLLASDQDRNVLAIFADHRHYAFPLLGEEGKQGEDAVIYGIMDDVAPGLSKQLQASKGEARELGTGPSMKLFMWQHVALEAPGRFLQLLDEVDRPILVKAPVSKHDLFGFK